MELLQVEIIRQTQVNSVLYMPGINKPSFPKHVCEELIARGDAERFGPGWDEDQKQRRGKKKRRSADQNDLGGVDRQMQGGVRGGHKDSLGAEGVG